MADELKDQRVVTMMSPTELSAIDDWMFSNRIRSRGEAIRRLCQIGLTFDGERDGIFETFADIRKFFREVSEIGLASQSPEVTDLPSEERSRRLRRTITGMLLSYERLFLAHLRLLEHITKTAMVRTAVREVADMDSLMEEIGQALGRAKGLIDKGAQASADYEEFRGLTLEELMPSDDEDEDTKKE